MRTQLHSSDWMRKVFVSLVEIWFQELRYKGWLSAGKQFSAGFSLSVACLRGPCLAMPARLCFLMTAQLATRSPSLSRSTLAYLSLCSGFFQAGGRRKVWVFEALIPVGKQRWQTGYSFTNTPGHCGSHWDSSQWNVKAPSIMCDSACSLLQESVTMEARGKVAPLRLSSFANEIFSVRNKVVAFGHKIWSCYSSIIEPLATDCPCDHCGARLRGQDGRGKLFPTQELLPQGKRETGKQPWSHR